MCYTVAMKAVAPEVLNKLPLKPEDLDELGVTRSTTPDEPMKGFIRRRKKTTNRTKRIRPRGKIYRDVAVLVGKPTPEAISKVIAEGHEPDDPDPSILVAARIMYLNGINPRQLCATLNINPALLNGYWAEWNREKPSYQEKLHRDAWRIANEKITASIESIVTQDLDIGNRLRAVVKALLERAEAALANPATDPNSLPDTKAVETLAKAFEKTAAVTHKMAGIGHAAAVKIDARRTINLPPGVESAPRPVQPLPKGKTIDMP